MPLDRLQTVLDQQLHMRTEEVRQLFCQGILATAIVYPVVPRGDDSIRFQINAAHTVADIDAVLAVLSGIADRAITPPDTAKHSPKMQ